MAALVAPTDPNVPLTSLHDQRRLWGEAGEPPNEAAIAAARRDFAEELLEKGFLHPSLDCHTVHYDAERGRIRLIFTTHLWPMTDVEYPRLHPELCEQFLGESVETATARPEPLLEQFIAATRQGAVFDIHPLDA